MTQYSITFLLNSQTKIIVPLQDSLSYVDWYYVEPILFSYNGNIITIANSPLFFAVKELRNFLKEAISNNLKLHSSITLDIGYLRNKCGKNIMNPLTNGLKKYFAIEDHANGLEAWKGYQYDVWYAYKNEKIYVTWIYNDQNGNIIFEITPFYPYFDCNKKKEKNYITFRQ